MEELIRRARQSIIDADEDEAMNLIREARARQLDVMELLRLGFAVGNNEVGSLFESGQISLPELIFSSEVMRSVLYYIEENISDKSLKVKGKVLIATVSGDVHEIGKGMVVSTMKSLGIDVIDIGPGGARRGNHRKSRRTRGNHHCHQCPADLYAERAAKTGKCPAGKRPSKQIHHHGGRSPLQRPVG